MMARDWVHEREEYDRRALARLRESCISETTRPRLPWVPIRIVGESLWDRVEVRSIMDVDVV